MSLLSLEDWLSWQEQSHPSEIDLGLGRVQEVAQRLNLLTPTATVITVAGTNGKGSCVTTTAALLIAAGKTVGIYTSPHIHRYNERVAINSIPVSNQQLCEAFSAIRTAANEISLTYFEYGTLAAFYIFKQCAVEFVVLEVGLGGRLDAVNIIDADIAVITSIDVDHQDWLGDNREVIAIEKAGIMRKGHLAISAEDHPPETLPSEAARIGATLIQINQVFGYELLANSWTWRGANGQGQKVSLAELPLTTLPLPSVTAALQVVSHLNLLPKTVHQVIGQLHMPGRFQSITYQDREVILDVAHNPAASEFYAQRLMAKPCAGKTYAAVGMMSDKDRQHTLANLVGLVDAWFLVDLSPLPRAASVDLLREDLSKLDQTIAGQGVLAECLKQLIAISSVGDRLVIFGSFYTVAAALAVLQPSS